MVDISNQHINEDGSITISFKDIEEAKEFVECVNIANEINEEMAKSFINYAYEDQIGKEDNEGGAYYFPCIKKQTKDNSQAILVHRFSSLVLS